MQNHNLFCFPFDFILNFDRNLVSSGGFKVYQGHHGDLNASTSNVILPATSFVEKSSFYANSSAVVQKTKKALFSPGNSRDD